MAFPGYFFHQRKYKPQQAPIYKHHNERKGYQAVVFAKDPFEKNKTGQQVNYAAGPNVVRRPANEPGNTSRKQNTQQQYPERNGSVEILKGSQQYGQGQGIVVQMLYGAMDKRAQKNAPKARKGAWVDAIFIKIHLKTHFYQENRPNKKYGYHWNQQYTMGIPEIFLI